MLKTPIQEKFEQLFYEVKLDYFEFMKKSLLSEKNKIKMSILSYLMEHIDKENSFALYDEKVFEIYSTILQSYKIFLDNYKSMDITLNKSIQKILNGIVEVLKSQVSFFDEKDNFGINPIATEKKGIIAICLDNIYKDIENFLKVPFQDFENLNIVQLKQHFIDYLKQNIIKSYRANLNICFTSINDSQNRKIINYYSDILEEEQAIITSIIKVQIKALEDLCQNDEEKDIIDKLLIPIIEVYQLSGKEFNEYIQNIKSINLTIKPDLDIQNIFNILDEILNFKFNFKDDLVVKLKDTISQYLEISFQEKVNVLDSLVNEIFSVKQTFQHITDEFKKIYLFTESNLHKYDDTNFKDIVNGIFESIKIKLENLEENKVEFFADFEQLVSDFDHIKNSNSFIYDFQEIYNSFIQGNLKFIQKDLFDKNFNKFSKLIENINKKLYNFRKDVLLFEISTFEEIVNYSIIKLREQKEVEDFLFLIDNATIEIQKILTSHNIFTIKPEPFSMFNAKEHEILIAEKNDQFKKGEIIKVLNCGYKIFDKVLIRANVIVAK